VSPKGALGLMQLMPARAEALGVADAFDPRANLDGGVRHLRDLLARYDGNVRLALAAYNAGEDAVRVHGGVPPFRETQEYVRKVLALYEGTRAPQAPSTSARRGL
jgi:soluble lytic murein transglycosylase-like protein